MRVPVGVVYYHGICRCQIQAETTRAGRQQHDEALELGAVEPLHRRRPHVCPRVAVKPLVLVARSVTVQTALKKVLTKARPKGKGGRKQRVERLQMRREIKLSLGENGREEERDNTWEIESERKTR